MLGIRFQGRINRLSYFGCLLTVGFSNWLLSEFANSNDGSIFVIVVMIVTAVYIAFFAISSAVRRFHDLDRSGWWCLLLLIPFFNLIIICGLLLAKGTKNTNRFGQNPIANFEEHNKEHPSQINDAAFQTVTADKDSGLPRKLSEWALTIVILVTAILIVGLW